MKWPRGYWIYCFDLPDIWFNNQALVFAFVERSDRVVANQ